MYKIFFKDCVLGQANTYSQAVTIAWDFASSIGYIFGEEVKQPFGRMNLIFYKLNQPEAHFIIVKEGK